MEFDQPVRWDNALAGQFYLDGEKGRVVSGTASTNTVTLRLAAPSEAPTLTYLDSRSWGQRTLLRGENGVAALTFCEVSILPYAQSGRADGAGGEKIKALIIDGQNNHDWKKTTPVLKAALESCGRFTVDVATAPQKMDDFKPDFGRYGVVVSNYNGAEWPEATRKAFEEYVSNGGGFVSVHAADNSFPKWAEYNKMIGVGGWGGRDKASGVQTPLARRQGREGPRRRRHARRNSSPSSSRPATPSTRS